MLDNIFYINWGEGGGNSIKVYLSVDLYLKIWLQESRDTQLIHLCFFQLEPKIKSIFAKFDRKWSYTKRIWLKLWFLIIKFLLTKTASKTDYFRLLNVNPRQKVKAGQPWNHLKSTDSENCRQFGEIICISLPLVRT